MSDRMTTPRKRIDIGRSAAMAMEELHKVSIHGGGIFMNIVNFWQKYGDHDLKERFRLELHGVFSPYGDNSHELVQVYFKHLLLMANNWQQATEVMNVAMDFVRDYDDRRNTDVDFGQTSQHHWEKQRTLIALFAGMIEVAIEIVSMNHIKEVEEVVLVTNKLIVFVVGRCERVERDNVDDQVSFSKVVDRLILMIKKFYQVVHQYDGRGSSLEVSKYFKSLLEDMRILKAEIKLDNELARASGSCFPQKGIGLAGAAVLKNLFFIWAERQDGIKLFDLTD